MKTFSAALTTLSLSAVPLWAAPQLVPQPAQMTNGTGTFTLTPNTIVVAKSAVEKQEAQRFAASIAPATGFNLRVADKAGKAPAIVFALDKTAAPSGEGYRLKVTPQGVSIAAPEAVGLFYATQTLRQLLPPQVLAGSKQANVAWQMPAVSIQDAPRFGWRGLMMDSGRHFFPVADVKKFLDVMALHKLNTFHWHLTEDQGWRLEIKKYPKLTEIGSKRAESPTTGARNQGDGTPYGGFYTQAQAREIVAYAKARHITVVPEIEIPGHAAAAIAAYPELGNTDVKDYAPHVYTIWGVHPYTFAPKAETFTFLENVLSEVLDIFPSTYIHIGGDEAPTTQWENSTFAQDFMKQHDLKSGHELQSYFNTRLEKFLNARGRKLIGWDEILEGGLAPNAAVMSWRGEGGAREAARQNHPFVMASNSAYYFDYGQGNAPGEPETIGGHVPLRRTYSFDPAAGIAQDKQHLELGVQGQLWSEYIADLPKLEYQAYPRACALAETAWSPAALKDYADFRQRMETHVERLRAMGVNFRPLDEEMVPVATWKSGQIGEAWLEKEWDVTPQIGKAGTVEVRFQYTGGTHRLDIGRVELLRDGIVVATDEHNGVTGGATRDNVYRLALADFAPGKYLLRARVRSDGGDDSNGDIFVEVKAIERVNVFTGGENGYPAVRIPSVILSKKGTLLAFAEGRKNLGDQAENKIILRRSTDGGKSWLPLQTIADDGKRPLNNPCAVIEEKSGRVFLMFQSYPENLKEADGKIKTGYQGLDIVKSYLISSDDDGQNWSQIRDITSQVKRPTGVTTLASGPGIGIQLQKGPHAGRLLIPFNEGPFAKWNIYTAYSDDGGATWQYGDIVPEATGLVNECQVAEMSDGRVRFNSRRGGGAAKRKTGVSRDGGQSWTPVQNSELFDPTCMASLITLRDPARQRMLFAGPLGPGRSNGTVHISYDDGATWPVSKTLFPGNYAYSNLVALPDGTLGNLYETDDHKHIAFARFSLQDVSDGLDEWGQKPPTKSPLQVLAAARNLPIAKFSKSCQ